VDDAVMTHRRLLVLFGLVAIVVGAVAPGAGASTASTGAGRATAARAGCRDTPRVVRDVRYDAVAGVDPDLLSLDLYLPTTGPDCPAGPLVVGVHGGGWRRGDKGPGFTGDKATLFNGRGWAFASVNYRLSNLTTDPLVRYPTHNQDVANAVGFLVDHAKEYDLDPDRIGILGHSAGAGIVAAIATDEQFLEDAGLGLDTLRCAFPDDTEGFDVTQRIAGGGLGARLYRFVFGPDPQVWEQASPINHVEAGKDVPPMLLTRRGEPSRIAQLEAFADALRGAGVDVEVIDATGYSHGEVNSLIGSTTDPVMTEPVTKFFQKCFAEDA
jgi:acetyl esterase/lipase